MTNFTHTKGEPLSPMQTAVFAFIGAGLLNKQIAYELGIAETTVKAHVCALFGKLGAVSRTQVSLMWHGVDDAGIAAALAEGRRVRA